MIETPRALEQGRVLAEVRRALGRSETVMPPPLEPFVEATAEAPSDELLARFNREVNAVGGRVYRASSVEEAAALVVRICEGAEVVAEVALSDAALLAEMNLSARLAARRLPSFRATDFGPAERGQFIKRLETCGAGVTAVDYAIAETGTVVLSSDEEGALLVSLLPAIHIAVLRARQIVGSLAEVVSVLKQERMERESPCRSVTFVTGPSRTSDVELVLSIGVHGPKQLHLIILDE